MTFQTLEQFFSQLRSYQSPALLWYSQPGERIELSGRVLENWVSKTANFLVDECDVEAGQEVLLHMETHWRSLVIALAALRVGACLRLNQEAAGDAETVFSFNAETLENLDVEYPVVVERSPLAPRYLGELPAGAVDYCAEVRACGDVYSQFETPEADDTALLEDDKPEISFRELLEGLNKFGLTLEQEETASFRVEEPQELTADYLIQVMGMLGRGRGVVVLDPSIDWTTERVQQVLTDERAKNF